MYKPNKENHAKLSFIKAIAYWLKKKIILIIVAFMVGLSNGMYEEDIMSFGNKFKIEQEGKGKTTILINKFVAMVIVYLATDLALENWPLA